MTSGVVAGTGGMMIGTLWLVAGVQVYRMGTVAVSVREKAPNGHHIFLIVPGAVVSAGMAFVPKVRLSRAAAEMRPWLPVIRAASEELARCPDADLVEVEDAQDKVRIAKRGEALVVDVDSDDATVHLSIPLNVVTSVVRRLQEIPATVAEPAQATYSPPAV